MFHRLLGCAPLFALFITGLSPVAADDDERVRHPRLHAALSELREARKVLKDSRDDFHGHRDKALRAIDDAMGSLKVILSVRDDNFRGIDRDPDVYKKYKNHPKIRQALHDLREARDELRDSRANFGGMKDRAMRDINVAIDQLQVLLLEDRR